MDMTFTELSLYERAVTVTTRILLKAFTSIYTAVRTTVVREEN
jgi:hypothetical protein